MWCGRRSMMTVGACLVVILMMRCDTHSPVKITDSITLDLPHTIAYHAGAVSCENWMRIATHELRQLAFYIGTSARTFTSISATWAESLIACTFTKQRLWTLVATMPCSCPYRGVIGSCRYTKVCLATDKREYATFYLRATSI